MGMPGDKTQQEVNREDLRPEAGTLIPRLAEGILLTRKGDPPSVERAPNRLQRTTLPFGHAEIHRCVSRVRGVHRGFDGANVVALRTRPEKRPGPFCAVFCDRRTPPPKEFRLIL